MNISLIPFGLSNKTGKFIDVSGVKRGIACDCICPSCKSSLIAKQGEIKQWHFSHQSIGTDKSSQNLCEFSFWVSVLSMSKQILSGLNEIVLPAYVKHQDSEAIDITKKNTLTFSDIAIEKYIGEQFFDAVIRVGDYTLGILFTTPQKKLNFDMGVVDKEPKLAVLEIRLYEAYHLLIDNKKNKAQVKGVITIVMNAVVSGLAIGIAKNAIQNLIVPSFVEIQT